MTKNIQDLLKSIDIIEYVGELDIEIAELHFDSRKVTKDDFFIAQVGTQSDGHDFITKAIEQGAKAILCERLPETINPKITYIQVENTSKALSTLAHNYYNYPSDHIKLVGVTGTNGKTTIASLLYELFRKLGYKVGLLSTVTNYIDTKEVKAHTHNP